MKAGYPSVSFSIQGEETPVKCSGSLHNFSALFLLRDASSGDTNTGGPDNWPLRPGPK